MKKKTKYIGISMIVLAFGLTTAGAVSSFARSGELKEDPQSYYRNTIKLNENSSEIDTNNQFEKDELGRNKVYSGVLELDSSVKETTFDKNTMPLPAGGDLVDNGLLLSELNGKLSPENSIKLSEDFIDAAKIQIVNPIVNFHKEHPQSKIKYKAEAEYPSDNAKIPSSIHYTVQSDYGFIIDYSIANVSNIGDINYVDGGIMANASEE